MSNYTVETIHDNGNVDVRFPDGSWARIKASEAMSQEDFDAEVWKYKPQPVTTPPSFLAEGQTGTASPPPTPIEGEVNPAEPLPAWLQNRIDAYGDAASQIEYITENGLEAWQAHVAEIKAMYPKE